MVEGAGTPSETVITADIAEVAVGEPGQAAKKATGRQMPRWEADARDRVPVTTPPNGDGPCQ
jgi:hypothetical protein